MNPPVTADAGIEAFDKIDSIFESQIAEGIVAGGVVFISLNNNILKHKAYGYRQIKDAPDECPIKIENPQKTTLDTIYDVASISKVMGTTLAIMKLVSMGRLSTTERVRDILPSFNSSDKKHITVEHLLKHTSGLPSWYPLYGSVYRDSDMALQLISKLPLVYDTDQERVYSDLGFNLLGFIVEARANKKLDIFLQDTIYSQMGLRDTMYNPPKNFKNRIAATSLGQPFEREMIKHDQTDSRYKQTAYIASKHTEYVEFMKDKWRNYTLIGEVNDGNAWYAMGGVAGAAGLFSTATELSMLGDMLVNYGLYNNERILDEYVVRDFISDHRLPASTYSHNPKERDKHGYGFELSTPWYMSEAVLSKAPNAFGHTGFTGGSVMFDAESKLVVIILCNRQNNGTSKSNDTYSKTYPSTNFLRCSVNAIAVEFI